MSQGYLFLGGPADGTRRVVPNSHPVFTYRVYPRFELGGQPDEVFSPKCTDHDYTRRELTGGLCVYAHTSIPTHEILPRLLRAYSPDAL